MPTPLVAQHYRDDFEVLTFPLITTPNGLRSEEGGNFSTTPILYADRDLIIDSITVSCSVVGSSGASVTVRKTTVGTASAPTTSEFAVTGGTAANLHSTAVSLTALGNTFVSLTTPNLDTNVVRAGNWLGIAFAGTAANARGLIQIRYRSRFA